MIVIVKMYTYNYPSSGVAESVSLTHIVLADHQMVRFHSDMIFFPKDYVYIYIYIAK